MTRTAAFFPELRAPGFSRREGPVKLRVGFVLTHNFTLTAFASFVDVLRLAADEGDRSRPIACAWQVMTPNRQPARSSCGLDIHPNASLGDAASFDYVVVVGGLLHGGRALPDAVARFLRESAAAGVTLVGVCTGSFVLCRLGLMTGRKCCVSWYHYRDFLEEFPSLVPIADRLFVADGDRITCSGGAGVTDLAAEIVARHLGAAAAQKALDILLVGAHRTGDSAQPAPAVESAAQTDDRRVSRALLLMEQNLAEPLPVAELASRLGLGIRQLQRLFKDRLGETPHDSYLGLRLRHGRWMLSNTSLPATSIAADVGFADGGHFGRAFKARFGVTPAGFRRAAHRDHCRAEAEPRVFE